MRFNKLFQFIYNFQYSLLLNFKMTDFTTKVISIFREYRIDQTKQSEAIQQILEDESTTDEVLKEFIHTQPKIVNRMLHLLSSNENTIKLSINFAKLIPDDIEHYPLMSLKVNIYAKTKQTHRLAVEIVRKMPNKTKRLYMPIFQGYLKWKPIIAFPFLYQFRHWFPLEYNDIRPFIETSNAGTYFEIDYSKLFEILQLYNIRLKGTFYTNSENAEVFTTLSGNVEGMSRVTVSSRQISEIRTLFNKKNFSKGKTSHAKYNFEKFLKEQNIDGIKYDMFVDGNNILHYHDRRVNMNGFQRLKNAYDRLVRMGYNPLIIIHRRHRDNLTKFAKTKGHIERMLDTIDIYYTPYGINDDIFFMWGGFVTPGSYIVSNDKFRDHIFRTQTQSKKTKQTHKKGGGKTHIKKQQKSLKKQQLHTQMDDELHLKRYFDQSMVTYNFSTRTDITFIFPPPISRCTQFNHVDSKWYIPTLDKDGTDKNQWYII
jgi:hypothetical protein